VLDPDFLSEADRQFSLCNACRYCEGLCAVFPAMELRTGFEAGDIMYLASLCHDCQACLDVCPFSPPHEFAIDIPAIMSRARSATFAHYARPKALWRLLNRPPVLFAAAGAALALFAAIALTSRGASQIVERHSGPNAFYQVIPLIWLLIGGIVASVLATGAILAGALRFLSDIRRGIVPSVSPRTYARAVTDALLLRNLSGGGGGCDARTRGTPVSRRLLHHLVFYGFTMMFLSTVSAAIEQDILGIRPPYPLFSVPVILGLIGGTGTAAGCLAFIRIGMRHAGAAKLPEARRLDRSFTTTLLVATVTGVLTLVLRATPAMGIVLLIHLAALSVLFITLPYSKFVHWVYRYIALVHSHTERPQSPAAAQG
jgi:citrate/tricarballylate utilization protein